MFWFTRRNEGPGRARRRGSRARPATRFACEPLERRMLLSITTTGIHDWLTQGPAPILGGGVNNIPGGNPVTGAVDAIAGHANEPNVLYVGSVNGGIWKTTSANFPNDSSDNDGDGLVDVRERRPAGDAPRV